MDKLLIAGPESMLIDELLEALRRQYDITVCSDGVTALELLRTLRPRAAIIDLALTELDGLYVIEQAMDFLPPILLSLTDVDSDYVMQTLQDLGVDFIFRKPCQPCSIIARLAHISAHKPRIQPADDHPRTGRILLSLGLAPKADGFVYLKFAIPLHHRDPSQLLCKEIYGAVVEFYGLSGWKVVERSIRRVIHDAWELDPDAWAHLFPGLTGAPTNKAFICRISELLDE